MAEELMTIKEFAEAVGLTRQAVYKQIDSRLNNFVVTVDGKKMLKKSALEMFLCKPELNNRVDKNDNLIKQLLNQLTAKDEQIERQERLFREQLEAKDKQIEQLLKLLDQQQQLTILTKKDIPEIQESEGQPKRHWWSIFKRVR